MAKFELKIHDTQTGEIVKTHKSGFVPVGLYIKFQQLSEKIIKDKVGSDAEMFELLKDLFREMFPELSSDEYDNQTDVAEILMMFREILDKSTQILPGDSKNA